MIDSLAGSFTKNNLAPSRKSNASGSDFQKTLSRYDQDLGRRTSQNQNSQANTFQYKNEDREYHNSDSDEYQETQSYDREPEERSVRDEDQNLNKSDNSSDDTSEVAIVEEERSEAVDDVKDSILALLLAAGVSKEDLQKLSESLKNNDIAGLKEGLKTIVDKLKLSVKNPSMAADAQKQLKSVISEFDTLSKTSDKNIMLKMPEIIKLGQKYLSKMNGNSKELPVDPSLNNKVDKDIKLNNAKFTEMKELAQGSKNPKLRADVDARFSQETNKNTQTMQNKPSAANLNTKASSGHSSDGESKNNSDNLAGKSPDFLKKMKTILKGSSNLPQSTEAAGEQSSKLQTNHLRPSFMNRATSGRFMNQLVNQIQNMVKSNTTLSASVDFKTAEFGDMKLAAEAQGTSLAVKLSNIASSMKLDILSLKSELDSELKALGFENVELDFGTENEKSQRHAFEEEMNKRLGRDKVKLPGDQIADLNAIDEWVKNFKKVM